MICFSDLDRTLIFSSKFNIDNNPCIEIYNGKEISFISKNIVNKVKEMQKSMSFIPVTTRTQEQYERIEFSKFGIVFPMAVVCNGGKILVDGRENLEYKAYIEELLHKSGSIEDVMHEFEKYDNIVGIIKTRVVENLFFYSVVDEDIFNVEYLNGFFSHLNKNNWNYFINGRKIYYIPEGISKDQAIKFIADKLKDYKFVAMGDSLMDLPMLKVAEAAYIPKHGELVAKDIQGINENLYISRREGMEAAEEILSEISK